MQYLYLFKRFLCVDFNAIHFKIISEMVFHLSDREIEIAKEKFEAIDRNKNGFINFEQLTGRIFKAIFDRK